MSVPTKRPSSFETISRELSETKENNSYPVARSIFGFFHSTSVAVWQNNAAYKAGTFDYETGKSLQEFLHECSISGSTLVIICLDSAGVSLNQPKEGIESVAESIRSIHRINMRASSIRTVALLGAKRGCFGGAFLIAGACQYRFAEPQTMSGVSGPKVIEAITKKPVDLKSYRTKHRIETGELDGVTPSPDELIDAFRQLPAKPLDRFILEKRFRNLTEHHLLHFPTNGTSPTASAPFPWNALEGRIPLSLHDLYSLLDFLMGLEPTQLEIVLKGNTVQPFDSENEKAGFSLYLNLLASTLAYLTETGHKITVEVNGPACGATFIAFPTMAYTLRLLSGATVDALPEEAVEALTGHKAIRAFEVK